MTKIIKECEFHGKTEHTPQTHNGLQFRCNHCLLKEAENEIK